MHSKKIIKNKKRIANTLDLNYFKEIKGVELVSDYFAAVVVVVVGTAVVAEVVATAGIVVTGAEVSAGTFSFFV